MAQIDRLLKNYTRYVELPWPDNLDGKQRIWFAIYPPAEERRLRAQLAGFDLATKTAGHGWSLADLTDAFPDWLAGYGHFQDYVKDPDSLAFGLPDFRKAVVEKISAVLRHPNADSHSVVALHGLAGLYGFLKVSEVVDALAKGIRGRLLVFFPGELDNNTYRFLDAREGWNYLATPITCQDSFIKL
jgi:hypothetical protein